MNTTTNIQTKRREDVAPPATQARAQMAMAEIPELFKTLGKQQGAIFRAINEQTAVIKDQLKMNTNQRDWTERLHDRIDALAIEGRVTNMLLAELVAVHKSIVKEDITESSEAIRGDAYTRVMNGA